MRTMESENIIEMLHITKEFPGIIANDDITLQLRRGEIPVSYTHLTLPTILLV